MTYVIQAISDRTKYWSKQGVFSDIEDAKQFTTFVRAYLYAESHIPPRGLLWRVVEVVDVA